ncbi:M23 family metallopeptidase [Streptomyces hoynatensis]|uniref:LysM peptidoglycan-binding domain-containing protein n=1 Tax=Streptomyces hoynatensis TaxID=1141874 RepID=A0A3A9YQ60_9ACTN|nr:LysM peptidoglycan-binding domain-containing M23 family metallopeptidase [Streptomyces hoynatensis]RKN37386.1 LysM peptidoglycan-binding domain-containing protein [Streptomyces hoynatensis]
MSAHGRHRRPRARRISRISLALTAGGAGVALPLVAAGAADASAPATYTVQSGDSLYRIAAEQDVDGGWQALYAANRDTVGADPSLIRPGQELVLGGAQAEGAADAAPTAAEDAASTAAQGAFVAPVQAGIGTGYGVAGSMWSSGHHTGVDFVVGTGTPVSAVGDGEVVSAGTVNAYGNEVIIKHADGHYSQYAHLSSISVSAGQTVSAGDRIGLSGATGNATGPHLHFEIRTGPSYGSDIDPIAYLREHGVSL